MPDNISPLQTTRRYPSNISQEHQKYFDRNLQLQLSKPVIHRLKGKIHLLKSGIVFQYFSPMEFSFLHLSRLRELRGAKYVFKQLYRIFVLRRFRRYNGHNVPAAIANEWTSGFFHWLTEAAPKLILLQNQGITATVLLPADHNKEYHTKLMNLLGIPFAYYSETLRLSALIYPSRLTRYPGHYHPELMKSMADRVKQAADLSTTRGRNIYVSRNSATRRKLLSENEVRAIVKKYDFEIIEFEDYSFEEQVSICHNASNVISIHGAGLTNIIFCKPGTNVLELSLEGQTLDKCYYHLADAMELNYYYLFCKGDDIEGDYVYQNLVVDLSSFEKTLLSMINPAMQTMKSFN